MQIILLLIALIVGAVGGYFTGTATSKTSSPTTAVQQKSVYDLGNIVLPNESVRVSACVPKMGYHWTRLEDLGIGPTYNVWDDKIIGIEYHLNLEDPTIPIELLGGKGELTLFNAKYDHVTFNTVPKGHGGKPEPHFDVHLYMIPRAEVDAITCKGAPAPATPSATTK